MKRKITLCGMLICSLSVLGSGAPKQDKRALFLMTINALGAALPQSGDEQFKPLGLKNGMNFPYGKTQAVVRALANHRDLYKKRATRQLTLCAFMALYNTRLRTALTALQAEHEATLAALTAAQATNQSLQDQIAQMTRDHQAAIAALTAQHGTALGAKDTELATRITQLQAEHRAAIEALTVEDPVLTELGRLEKLQQDRWEYMDRCRSARAQRPDVRLRLQEIKTLVKMIDQLKQVVGVPQAGEEQALTGDDQAPTLMQLVQKIDAQTAQTQTAVQAAAQASAARRAAQASGGLAAVGRGALGALGALGVVQQLMGK
jgi:hypothetical protein